MAPRLSNGVVEAPASPHQLIIDFMYLDLETCTRCRGTDGNLDAALAEVARVLDAAGVDVAVHKMQITSVEQAHAVSFISSPTIRVNGNDVALELRESSCDECGEACGCDGSVDCRVWLWQGEEHTVAPQPMIVDAILREVYGGSARPLAAAPAATVPENLERYFAGKAQLAAEAGSTCCSPAEQASCCEPSEKASCCGEASSGGCGCQ